MYWNQILSANSDSFDEQEQLMNELYRQMFIVSYSVMRNKFDAMDVVQESWIKILQKLDTLKDHKKIIKWAKVIAYHTAINMLKQKQSRENDPILHKDPSAQVMDEEQIIMRSTVEDKMGELDVLTRTILLYKYTYQLRDQEIADRLQMAVGTVKARIHRGKERLKERLQDYNP